MLLHSIGMAERWEAETELPLGERAQYEAKPAPFAKKRLRGTSLQRRAMSPKGSTGSALALQSKNYRRQRPLGPGTTAEAAQFSGSSVSLM